MVFVQITEYDWLPGQQKGYIFEKQNVKKYFSPIKLLLFINAYGIILYIICAFLFDQIRTLVAIATFSLLWLYLANSQVSVYRSIGPLVYNQDRSQMYEMYLSQRQQQNDL